MALANVLVAAGVREGMTRLEVEASMGKPVSVLLRGNRLVLSYPNGGRVELIEGRVVDMLHVPVATDAQALPVPPVSEAEPADSEESEPDQSVDEMKNVQEPSPKGAVVPVAKPPTLEERLTAMQERAPQERPALGGILLVVLIGGVIRIVIVMVVLKLAFKWADVHAEWGQMFLPALADTIVRSTFEFVGTAVLHVMSWFYFDEATAYIVLLIVLMKTTHACTLSRAVGVAAAAKLMSIVVGGMVMVYVMHALS
ncbi:MAG: hypothetical protein IPP19_01360 [Verrucomicrobia bacterium]|nr:hypothetical protein [Verrucomicrobiota bacterium]